MAKKIIKAKSKSVTQVSSKNTNYKPYFIPALVGAVVAWFASGDEGLAIAVFIAVWAGIWFVSSRKK